MSIVSRVKACTTSEIAGCIQKDGFVSRVTVMVTIHFRWVTTRKFVGSDCSCKRVVVRQNCLCNEGSRKGSELGEHKPDMLSQQTIAGVGDASISPSIDSLIIFHPPLLKPGIRSDTGSHDLLSSYELAFWVMPCDDGYALSRAREQSSHPEGYKQTQDGPNGAYECHCLICQCNAGLERCIIRRTAC